MNAKRTVWTIVISCFYLSAMCASKNDKGIEYYRAELYDAAKLFFSNQTNLSQEEQAENYFYLGQTYAAMEQLDSAAYFYNKAVTVDPEYPYGYIGQGMLELRNNHKEKANDLFKKATGLVKKNPAVHTAIAEAYINAKQYDKAEEALDRARKMQKNFSGIYVAEGDMLMDQGDTGGACGKYDNAILFDKNDKVAYLKEARVYKSINTDLALEMLNRLVEIDPEYIPAYAELGEIYYRDGYYTKAIDAYEKIMAIPGVPISQESKYAQLLFFVDRYSESLDMIARVLEKDPENFVMKRLQAYNNFKLENYALGLEQMEKLINDTPPDNLIALDYTYYGRLLIKEKQPQKALENLLKAYEMDTTKTELLKEIATAYENTGNYAEAVNYTQKSLDANPESTAIDYFYFGRLCWTAAVSLLTPEASKTAEELAADSIQRNDYLETAIKAFDTVIERMPQSYMGYFWKGKVNYIKDFVLYKGEEGLPKPDYEQALAILLESNEGGKRNKEIIEVYDYLGSYYIVKEDSKAAVEYWKKILELDPANAKALKVMEEFKKSGVE